MPPPLYPDVNGQRVDWSCITITARGVPFTGIKSIKYKDSLKGGVVRGTRAQKTGRTRGQYDTEASMEVYKEDWQELIGLLSDDGAQGFMEVSFPVLVQYQNSQGNIISDTLVGCRIASGDTSPGESADAVTVSCDLDPMYILWDGISALSPDQLLR